MLTLVYLSDATIRKCFNLLEVIPSQNGGPYAIKTFLGWSVIGPRFSKRPSEKNCVFFVKTKFSAVCDMCMDVCNLETTEASIENKRFLAEVNDSIKLKENNHYGISLPLKFSNLKPAPNREFAYQRLMSLKIKFFEETVFLQRLRTICKQDVR